MSSYLDQLIPDKLSPAIRARTVVTIGNFDGVHRGHQTIIAEVRERAAERGAVSLALTFEPHPVSVFRDQPQDTFRLTAADEREQLLMYYGIEQVFTIPFSRQFAALTAEEFVHGLLIDRLGACEVHIGYDFAFGRGREGTTQRLQELCGERGVDVHVRDAVEADGATISSTRVREALRAGALGEVTALQGHHWFISGQQAHGHARGRQMGAPTVNLYPEQRLLPPHGVYVTRLMAPGRSWRSISNLGTRPTFADDPRVSLETHVLEPFDGVPDGTPLRVLFLEHVRPERAFESPEALREQIGRDVAVAASVHERTVLTPTPGPDRTDEPGA